MAFAEQPVLRLAQGGVDDAAPIRVQIGVQRKPAGVVESFGDGFSGGVGLGRFRRRGGGTDFDLQLGNRRQRRQLSELGVPAGRRGDRDGGLLQRQPARREHGVGQRMRLAGRRQAQDPPGRSRRDAALPGEPLARRADPRHRPRLGPQRLGCQRHQLDVRRVDLAAGHLKAFLHVDGDRLLRVHATIIRTFESCDNMFVGACVRRRRSASARQCRGRRTRKAFRCSRRGRR
ncbi:hypothetical protein BH18ACT2_BH18ACT2_18740 [soil metagenome]